MTTSSILPTNVVTSNIGYSPVLCLMMYWSISYTMTGEVVPSRARIRFRILYRF